MNGHYLMRMLKNPWNDSIPSVPRVFLYNRAHIYGYQLLASSFYNR